MNIYIVTLLLFVATYVVILALVAISRYRTNNNPNRLANWHRVHWDHHPATGKIPILNPGWFIVAGTISFMLSILCGASAVKTTTCNTIESKTTRKLANLSTASSIEGEIIGHHTFLYGTLNGSIEGKTVFKYIYKEQDGAFILAEADANISKIYPVEKGQEPHVEIIDYCAMEQEIDKLSGKSIRQYRSHNGKHTEVKFYVPEDAVVFGEYDIG